jgi:hypothetical protein
MRTILCAAVAANCFTSPVMAEVQTWPKSEPEWPMKTCPYQDNFDIYTETIPYFHEGGFSNQHGHSHAFKRDS